MFKKTESFIGVDQPSEPSELSEPSEQPKQPPYDPDCEPLTPEPSTSPETDKPSKCHFYYKKFTIDLLKLKLKHYLMHSIIYFSNGRSWLQHRGELGTN